MSMYETIARTKGLRTALRGLRTELTFLVKHSRGVRKARAYRGRTGLRLNVGCGPNIKDGWVNVDLSRRADLTLDLRQPLPLESGSCSMVYSEHFFEHLDYPGDAMRFLQESFRVLESGGTFSVGVPDTAWPLEEYHGGGAGYFEHARSEWPFPEWCETELDYINYHFRQDNEHRYAYDEETLGRALVTAGFVNVRRREYVVGLDTESRARGTLYMDATRP